MTDYLKLAQELNREQFGETPVEIQLRARIRVLQEQLRVHRHDHDQKLDVCNGILNCQVALAEEYRSRGLTKTQAQLRAQQAL